MLMSTSLKYLLGTDAGRVRTLGFSFLTMRAYCIASVAPRAHVEPEMQPIEIRRLCHEVIEAGLQGAHPVFDMRIRRQSDQFYLPAQRGPHLFGDLIAV